MKKLFLFTGIILLQTIVHAQDCKSFYFFQNNKTVEMSIFNKRGDANGVTIYKVSNVVTKGNALSAIVKTELFDKNKKSIGSGVNDIRCEAGVIMMDMKLYVPQQQAEQFSKTDAKAKHVYLEYPSAMANGDNLKDGSFEMEMDNNGLKQTLKMEITNRRVTGQDKITTKAGSWNCFSIAYKIKLNMQTGPIAIPLVFDATEWYAPGFGVVKTSSQSGTMEVTAIR